VRLLLDSHALIWWLGDDPTLSCVARACIDDGDNLVAVSAATTWEITIKRSLGKLTTPDDLQEQIIASEFVALSITIEDGISAGRLPRHHGDPFDRMLIAQAQAGKWTIVTRDRHFAAYGVDILPA
jgi:PIN domain nuclease of toxin-antitoxin system